MSSPGAGSVGSVGSVGRWGDGEMGRFVLRVIISTLHYSLKGNPGKQGIPVIESG
ncbi:MAG: hypothetical protein F6K50_33895 [Moorea sp. SIO3I7]|uniref:hypothetical protein n=1 Tax=unclassified Moorena TaxID=2683338 RepID=UPI0013C02B53|nr:MULTISPECIES: hypothetical protein [unclassified Moorena]NEO00273.1 hypothetical protein [Moorena sp. SIO3I7]NEO07725.1 hypothetical protein [Moorena sp. SIO3I8]NEO63808.1 hypothetical protein [Moorena sp. SIO4G2]NEP24018.1 hypothetical protein [Moorena sp. SIO3I6]NEQ58320.1 hypothetical protein [Moorena sp. SIO4A1]